MLLRLLAPLLILALAAWPHPLPAAGGDPAPVTETLQNVTLRDGTKADSLTVFGFWTTDEAGNRIFVRIDPSTGRAVSAFVPRVERTAVVEKKLVDEVLAEDPTQTRTLYPVEVPTAWHSRTGKVGYFAGGDTLWMWRLQVREVTTIYPDGRREVDYEFTPPWGISYPFDDRPLTEEWRLLAACLRNPNSWENPDPAWGVVAEVWSPAGHFPSVYFAPGEERWIRHLLPGTMTYYRRGVRSDCWEDDGGKPLRLYYMIREPQFNVETRIIENRDPWAPERYRKYPPSDDDPRTAVWGVFCHSGVEIARACDVADWEGSWPEPKKLREKGQWAYIWRLVPAFKRTPRWVPDPVLGDPWGRVEFDSVPGWAWEWDVLYPPSNISWDRWDPYMWTTGMRYLGASGTDEYWLFEFESRNDGRNSDPCIFSISSIHILPRDDVRDWKGRLNWYRKIRLDVPQRPSVRLAPGQSGRLWIVVRESLVPEYSWYGWVKGYRLEYAVVDAGGPERSFDASWLTTANKEKLKEEKEDKVKAQTFEDDPAARTYGWAFSFKGRAAAAVYGHFSPDGYGLVQSGEYGGFAGPVAVPESYVDDAPVMTAGDLADMVCWARWGDLRNNMALLLNTSEDDGKPGVTFGAYGGWGGWYEGGGA